MGSEFHVLIVLQTKEEEEKERVAAAMAAAMARRQQVLGSGPIRFPGMPSGGYTDVDGSANGSTFLAASLALRSIVSVWAACACTGLPTLLTLRVHMQAPYPHLLQAQWLGPTEPAAWVQARAYPSWYRLLPAPHLLGAAPAQWAPAPVVLCRGLASARLLPTWAFLLTRPTM